MDRSEIFDKIAEIAADVLGVDVADISDETTFDDLDADSLERLQLVTAHRGRVRSRDRRRDPAVAQFCRRRRRRDRKRQGGLNLGIV